MPIKREPIAGADDKDEFARAEAYSRDFLAGLLSRSREKSAAAAVSDKSFYGCTPHTLV